MPQSITQALFIYFPSLSVNIKCATEYNTDAYLPIFLPYLWISNVPQYITQPLLIYLPPYLWIINTHLTWFLYLLITFPSFLPFTCRCWYLLRYTLFPSVIFLPGHNNVQCAFSVYFNFWCAAEYYQALFLSITHSYSLRLFSLCEYWMSYQRIYSACSVLFFFYLLYMNI